MAEQYSIIWLYHTFITNSPSEWHMGCFYLLAITNKAALNNCMDMFSFVLGKCLGVERLNHTVGVWLTL